eukprot:CAMPEP_0206195010 /NCGR_PEP_ID=MMETSP0166-20121206/7563_1 /ASSEMBLY_ACC=CAM_ASM_000260 /TAXON_ID=95228 /ORGANISM="Vannella robusta, Strain DIVA3 518/3/11/1/6" /LENGTH=394 /DNA_ID=CAMNT_0053612143 /DNA_START=407 /DNA_END=1587 /DNA_ORIENTATION=+
MESDEFPRLDFTDQLANDDSNDTDTCDDDTDTSVTDAEETGAETEEDQKANTETEEKQDNSEQESGTDEEDSDFSDFEDGYDEIVEKTDTRRFMMLMIDRHKTNEIEILPRLDVLFPFVPKFGTITNDKEIRFVNGKSIRGGTSGVIIEGDIEIDFVNSQGYFPLGKPFKITEVEGNEIASMNGLDPVEAIDVRLESFGFSRDSPVLYEVITTPSDPKNRLRKNSVRLLMDSNMQIEDPIQLGDTIQFYAYDYLRVIPDIGEKLAEHADDTTNKFVVGFSSLTNIQDNFSSKLSSNRQVMVLDSKSIQNSNSPFNFKDLQGTTNSKTKETKEKTPKQAKADFDLYPDHNDIKQEVIRLVRHQHNFSKLSGAVAHRTLVPSDKTPTETSASLASV